ncbi:MAG: amidohydrolase family protein [Acidobacteriota bacterium]
MSRTLLSILLLLAWNQGAAGAQETTPEAQESEAQESGAHASTEADGHSHADHADHAQGAEDADAVKPYEPEDYPAVAFEPASWRAVEPEQPDIIFVRGASVVTSGPAGAWREADLLVEKGIIKAVGPGLYAPEGALIIDGAGKTVTPGIIDAHSHTAIFGGVNEGSNITTAEVRIADVIDAGDVNLYRQLAGGVTSANLLHGSANSIGGQNAVIKLRWGAPASGLLFDDAPQGIKFALGENPKQSNWGVDTTRYPQTRQGVEQSIRERFDAALDYRAAFERYEKAGGAQSGLIPPRRDLQIEAMLEIIDGTRLVHAHSYRADEILMLLSVAEDYGFTIASFQHVLEGYKVADELAAAGAGASTFSDWWAFKYEVVDAIPWNGAIMWDRGVVTSFNSDSSELARRLNLEGSKAIRYGGVNPMDALKFVTINPAIQLGIDEWVGSLEPGKHADFVIWSGPPYSTYSIVLETWIDGRKYFDRRADLEARERIAAERQALIAAVRAAEDGDKGEDNPEATNDESDHAHYHGPHQHGPHQEAN